MARTDVVHQTPTRTGTTVTFTPATVDGHMFVNNGQRHLRIKNTDGTPKTITVLYGDTIDGQITGVGRAVVVPAGAIDFTTGTWPVGDYNQPTDKVHLDYSAITGVSIAVVEVV